MAGWQSGIGQRQGAGWFFVVDPDGVEVPGSRRAVPAEMDHAAAAALRTELERGLGPGCSVEFRPE